VLVGITVAVLTARASVSGVRVLVAVFGSLVRVGVAVFAEF
jgi:hypothetical protein